MKTNDFHQSLSHIILSILMAIGILFLSSFPQKVNAQTLTVYADSIVADTGEVINLSVRIRDFKDIFTIQFGLSWDTEVLEFIELINLASLPDFRTGYFNIPAKGDSILTFAYFDPTISGQTLIDDTPLFTLVFKVVGNQGTESEIDIGKKKSVDAEASTLSSLVPLNIEKGVVQVRQPPVPIPETLTPPIPALNQWALLIFGLLVLNFSLVLIYRKMKVNN